MNWTNEIAPVIPIATVIKACPCCATRGIVTQVAVEGGQVDRKTMLPTALADDCKIAIEAGTETSGAMPESEDADSGDWSSCSIALEWLCPVEQKVAA